MNLKTVLFALFSLLLMNTHLSAQKVTKKPNVIFILGDDIGYDLPTVNGGQSYSTPNIDSLARNGISFTHCESAPLCNPSRQMLLTGRENFRNYSNWGYMNDTAKTIGNVMRDAGYATGFFGKLQLQMHTLNNMNQWGWDKFTVFEIVDDTDAVYRRYKSPNLVDNNGRVPDAIVNGNYCDDILTTRILDFIDSNKKKPFFVYYPMSIGHTPFSPTPDDPEYAAWDPTLKTSDTSFFPSMMKYMDKKIGQILAKLKQEGLDGNTLVIYAGDNGTPNPIYYRWNGVVRQGEKGKNTEGGTHVPLIAYCPNYIKPGVNDDLINFTDFFPTLAAVAQNKNLSRYAPLDGVSFFNRLQNKTGDSVRSNLFVHYNPNPGIDDLYRWTRDKNYKLYDTTGTFTKNKFFDIVNDPQEKKALDTNHLTQAQATTRSTFRHILDTSGPWPKNPMLANAFATNITNNSAIVTGTVVSSGASRLIERGSTIDYDDVPYYRQHHIADASAALGTFSQTRTKLMAQTQYFFAIYGMNANESNSTGYIQDTFYTLSNPPLKQPTSLQVADKSCGVTVTWNNASYPKAGATVGGYILIYSTNPIVLNTAAANGQAPSALVTDNKARMVNVQATLPSLPAVTADINTLSKDSLYYFTLVPYTFNGKLAKTYDYLTKNVLPTTKKPSQNGCNALLMTAETLSALNMNSVTVITPNPSRNSFTLVPDKNIAGKQGTVIITDAAGRIVYQWQGRPGAYIVFGNGWKAGVYLVRIKTGSLVYSYKAVKEE